MPRGRATLKSVAERARVSRQTVSNVLNAPHLVLPETQSRVRGAIDELNYRPHRGARSLRTSRSQLIAMRLDPFRDGVNGSVLDRFLHALTESAEGHGYRVLLFTAADDGAEVAAYDELLSTHDLDAFVLTGTHHGDQRTSWLAERDIPFVTFGRPWGAASDPATEDSAARHSWVDIDGSAGTAEVTERLLAAGHRRVGFLGWPAGSGVGDDRRAGWQRAMDAAGRGGDRLTVEVPDGVRPGSVGADALLSAREPVSAIVCASDSLACGALSALAERGASTPDVPVIGFDDTAIAGALGLTSFAQPLAAAAARCVRLLTDLLDPRPGVEPQPAHVLLPPQLVVRRSGGGLPA